MINKINIILFFNRVSYFINVLNLFSMAIIGRHFFHHHFWVEMVPITILSKLSFVQIYWYLRKTVKKKDFLKKILTLAPGKKIVGLFLSLRERVGLHECHNENPNQSRFFIFLDRAILTDFIRFICELLLVSFNVQI